MKSEKNKTKQIEGIPDSLDLGALKKWVQKRVSTKRFKHIAGVAEAGEKLANLHGIDPLPVVLACWLHDSCKEIKASELVQMAEDYAIELTDMDKKNGHILHGPVAAQVVKEKFAITSHDVLTGIAEHTLGGLSMTTVSKIVYLADTLEASRPKSLTDPIWQSLNGSDQSNQKTVDLDLDRAILKSSDLVITHLIESGKAIHPKAIAVRNHFLELVNTNSKAD